MLRCLIAPVLALLLAAPVSARDADALFEALALDRIIAIMREEGVRHGEALAEEMFPGRIGSGWPQIVARIHDPAAMEGLVRKRFAAAMADADVAALVAFYEGPLGRRIIGLEVEAREAMLAPDIEAAAQERWADMQAEADPRVELIEGFALVNDLVESNVAGSMNANYAFYLGLVDSGLFESDMSEDQILADVWSQEEAIRLDTEAWVFAYLALAYRPLEDEEIATYTALSRTEEGRGLNRALFDAFDAMYVSLSHRLGLAAGAEMLGHDL